MPDLSKVPLYLHHYAVPTFKADPTGKATYRRMVSFFECDHLMEPDKLRVRLAEIEEKGADDPLVQSWLFGRFMRRGATSAVFTQTEIDSVKIAMSGGGTPIEGPRKAAVDFSAGGDSQCMILGEGTHVKDIREYRESNQIALARRWVTEFQSLGIMPCDVYADAGGMGKLCIQYMETDLGFVGMRSYLNNAKPRHRFRFFDRYTEDHWRLKRLIILGQLRLPKCDSLLQQIERRRFKEVEHKVLKLEDKQTIRNRGEDSPDVLDALVMLISDVNVEGYHDLLAQVSPDTTREMQSAATVARKGATVSDTGKFAFLKVLRDNEVDRGSKRNRFGIPQKGLTKR
jgi:hypothetical protein